MFGTIFKSFGEQDLKEIYDTYFESIRNFVYYRVGDMQLAEDLTQEVFIRVWDRRKDIKMTTIKSYLYKVAQNLVINHVNHLKVVRNHEESVTASQSVESGTPEFVFEEKEFEKTFNEVMAAMPEGSREVFLMNRVDDLKYRQIAERLQISQKAVEKRMTKALQIIKEKLGKKV